MAAIPSGGTRSFVGVDTSGLGRESGPVTLGRHTALAEWGPRGGDTADGARSLNHGLLLLFLIGYPRLGRGRRKDCVHLWVL